VTLPVESLEAAGLRPGGEVVIEAEGVDRIVVHRAAPAPASALGVFDGLYEPGYLEKLRSEERGLSSPGGPSMATCVSTPTS